MALLSIFISDQKLLLVIKDRDGGCTTNPTFWVSLNPGEVYSTSLSIHMGHFFSIRKLFSFFFGKISNEFDRRINRSKQITFPQSEWNRKILRITENMYHLGYFPSNPKSLKGSQWHTSINYESSMAYCQQKLEFLWLFHVWKFLCISFVSMKDTAKFDH